MYIYIYTYTHRISNIYHWYQVDRRGFRRCWPEEHTGVPSKRSVQTNMRKHGWICMVYTSISKKSVYMCILYHCFIQSEFSALPSMHIDTDIHLEHKVFSFLHAPRKNQMAVPNSSKLFSYQRVQSATCLRLRLTTKDDGDCYAHQEWPVRLGCWQPWWAGELAVLWPCMIVLVTVHVTGVEFIFSIQGI